MEVINVLNHINHEVSSLTPSVQAQIQKPRAKVDVSLLFGEKLNNTPNTVS